MKKVLVLFVTLALLCTAVFAQGSEESNKGPVTLEFWHAWSGSDGEKLQAVVDAFNASHDDIKVNATFQGSDYWDLAAKCATAISTGTAPDLMMVGTDHVSIFSSRNLVEDIAKWAKNDKYDMNDLVEAFTNTYWGPKGELWALGWGRSCPQLYVNLDMLAKIGADVPTTYAELDAVSQKLIAEGICEYGWSMPYDSQYPQMIIPQFGGNVWNADDTGLGCIEDGSLVRALTTLQNQVRNKTLYYGPQTDSNTVCRNLFINQKCAFYLHSCSQISTLASKCDFNWDACPVPGEAKTTVNTGGCTITMCASSEHKKAAWEFLKWYLTSDEGSAYISVAKGYLPLTKSIQNSKTISEFWAKTPQAKHAFDNAAKYAVDFRNNHTGDCLEAFKGVMAAVLYNPDANVKQAVAEFNKEVTAIFSK